MNAGRSGDGAKSSEGRKVEVKRWEGLLEEERLEQEVEGLMEVAAVLMEAMDWEKMEPTEDEREDEEASSERGRWEGMSRDELSARMSRSGSWWASSGGASSSRSRSRSWGWSVCSGVGGSSSSSARTQIRPR